MNAVHLVVPDGIRDPRRPSGGNVYDRCLARALRERAWTVHEWPVAGDWPRPDAGARDALARCLDEIPDDAVVLIDGLVGSCVPDLLARHRERLRHVLLVHMPLGHGGVGERHTERVALAGARAVLTTSDWTRDWLVATYALAAGLVHVARPGVDDAVRSLGTPTGGALLCVAAVIPAKGQDVLVEALATMADLPWTCTSGRRAAATDGSSQRGSVRSRPPASTAGAAISPTSDSPAESRRRPSTSCTIPVTPLIAGWRPEESLPRRRVRSR